MSALHIITLSLTAGAVALSVIALQWRSALRFGRFSTTAAALSATLGLAVRWAVSGHAPIFGTFENTYTLAWALLATATVVGFVRRDLEDLWRMAVPWALASMTYGLQFRSEPVPLTISEQSLWVDIHAVFAWIALVSFLGVTSLAAVRVIGGRPLGLPAERSDDLMTELLMIGYAGFTGMLATGAWYSFVLFGTFWQWDIVESLALVTWLSYGVVIHGRLFYRWGSRRFDMAVLLVLPLLIAAYFVWSFFPDTWHFFDIPLVKPY